MLLNIVADERVTERSKNCVLTIFIQLRDRGTTFGTDGRFFGERLNETSCDLLVIGKAFVQLPVWAVFKDVRVIQPLELFIICWLKQLGCDTA